MDTYETLIKTFEKYIVLTPEEKELVKKFFIIRTFNKKDFLVNEGELCEGTFYILKGCVHSFFKGKHLEKHTTHFAIEDWWITDMTSIIFQKLALTSIQALEPTTALFLSIKQSEKMFEAIPKMEKFFRILSQRNQASFQQRILHSLSMNATERYLNFREKYGFLESRVPQYMIASFLGITPEFLSIIRNKLSKQK